MRKKAAAGMAGLLVAALLLGGRMSNTEDETKKESTSKTGKTSEESADQIKDETEKNAKRQETDAAEQTADGQNSDVPDEKAQNSEASAKQAEFSQGIYVGDGESITITDANDAIQFSFAQAGITGRAVIDGDVAVYSGDDDHQIEFRQDGTILHVTVTGAKGEESDSPLAGTYVKEAD